MYNNSIYYTTNPNFYKAKQCTIIQISIFQLIFLIKGYYLNMSNNSSSQAMALLEKYKLYSEEQQQMLGLKC